MTYSTKNIEADIQQNRAPGKKNNIEQKNQYILSNTFKIIKMWEAKNFRLSVV